MTTQTPLQPIVVRLERYLMPVYIPGQYVYTQILPNRYYWYKIEIWRAQSTTLVGGGWRVLSGKTWAYPVSGTNNGYIEINVSDCLKQYMYESKRHIKPEYDFQTHEFVTTWNHHQEEVCTLDTRSPKADGFGVTQYFVTVYPALDGDTHLNYYPTVTGEITSSWNMYSPAYFHSDNFILQNLLEIEFRKNFISHYPKIMTTNFGLFGMINISDGYLNTYQQLGPYAPIYIGNQVSHDEGGTTVYDAIELRVRPGTGLTPAPFYGGYLPFKLTLADILSALRIVSSTQYSSDTIIGADADDNIDNIFSTGTSVQYTPDSYWRAGDSYEYSSSSESETSPSNTVYIMTPDYDRDNATGLAIPIATFDECYSDYYLVWMTRSCTPACYGFDGNTIFSQDFDNTYMKDRYSQDILKLQTVTNNWELKSGVIDKDTYSVMEDIYTSPYLLLYDTKNDKSIYVKCMDDKFTRKNKVKEDQRPFTFSVNLTEVHQNELLH